MSLAGKWAPDLRPFMSGCDLASAISVRHCDHCWQNRLQFRPCLSPCLHSVVLTEKLPCLVAHRQLCVPAPAASQVGVWCEFVTELCLPCKVTEAKDATYRQLPSWINPKWIQLFPLPSLVLPPWGTSPVNFLDIGPRPSCLTTAWHSLPQSTQDLLDFQRLHVWACGQVQSLRTDCQGLSPSDSVSLVPSQVLIHQHLDCLPFLLR